MSLRTIRKSLVIESEPVLQWPRFATSLEELKGFELRYQPWIDPTEYELDPSKGASVKIAKLNFPTVREWRNIFNVPRMEPSGLMSLARLHNEPSDIRICEWLSKNGPLGFRLHESGSLCNKKGPRGDDHLKRLTLFGDVLLPQYEPLPCIRSAAQRAANVLALWKALRASYEEQGSSKRVWDLRSIITFIKGDPLPGRIALTDNSTIVEYAQVEDGEPLYRVTINGEPRSLHPIPKSTRDWRKLASTLLAEYINDHLDSQLLLTVRIRGQNKDMDEEERGTESTPEWNLKPLWHVQSALAAYYVEFLMVMRRFRTCSICGNDISHQKAQSSYCGHSSTCRSKHWHRQRSAQRKADKAPRC